MIAYEFDFIEELELLETKPFEYIEEYEVDAYASFDLYDSVVEKVETIASYKTGRTEKVNIIFCPRNILNAPGVTITRSTGTINIESLRDGTSRITTRFMDGDWIKANVRGYSIDTMGIFNATYPTYYEYTLLNSYNAVIASGRFPFQKYASYIELDRAYGPGDDLMYLVISRLSGSVSEDYIGEIYAGVKMIPAKGYNEGFEERVEVLSISQETDRGALSANAYGHRKILRLTFNIEGEDELYGWQNMLIEANRQKKISDSHYISLPMMVVFNDKPYLMQTDNALSFKHLAGNIYTVELTLIQEGVAL